MIVQARSSIQANTAQDGMLEHSSARQALNTLIITQRAESGRPSLDVLDRKDHLLHQQSQTAADPYRSL